MIGNLPNFYFSLQKKGYYLPERKSKAINGEYLWKVFTKQVYCPMSKDVKIGRCKEKKSKIALLEYLEEDLNPETVGMDEEHLPEKSWLSNTLFTINPNHDAF